MFASLVSSLFQLDTERTIELFFLKFLLVEFYTDEHYRARRQANSGNNNSKAKTTATMIKEIHKLFSEGRPRLGFDDFSRN